MDIGVFIKKKNVIQKGSDLGWLPYYLKLRIKSCYRLSLIISANNFLARSSFTFTLLKGSSIVLAIS